MMPTLTTFMHWIFALAILHDTPESTLLLLGISQPAVFVESMTIYKQILYSSEWRQLTVIRYKKASSAALYNQYIDRK